MGFRWRVALKGDHCDLERLERDLRTSDFRVLRTENDFFLAGNHFEKFEMHQQVYNEAQGLVATINISFQTAHSDFESVSFGDYIVDKRPNGEELRHAYMALSAR